VALDLDVLGTVEAVELADAVELAAVHFRDVLGAVEAVEAVELAAARRWT
jgi:hypothetical protein